MRGDFEHVQQKSGALRCHLSRRVAFQVDILGSDLLNLVKSLCHLADLDCLLAGPSPNLQNWSVCF